MTSSCLAAVVVLPVLTAALPHPSRSLTLALCPLVPQSTPLVVLPLPSLAWLLCKHHLLYGSYYSTGSSVRQYQPASRPSRSGARLYATMVAKDLGYCGDGMMIPFISWRDVICHIILDRMIVVSCP